MRRTLSTIAPALFAVIAAGCAGVTSIAPGTPAGPSSSVSIQSGSSSATATLPAISTGHSATVTIPVETSGSAGTLAATLQATLPSGVTAPQSIKRAPAAIGASLSPIVYLTLTSSATVTFNSTPAFTFSLPSNTMLAAGSSAWVAFYDPGQAATGWQTLLGPGSVNGRAISFAAATNTTILKAGVQYAFLLFTTAQTVALATPSPSGSCPTAAPSFFPMKVVNNTTISGPITVYVAGLNPTNLTYNTQNPANYCYLTSATGAALAPLPANNVPIPGFTLPPNGIINLPPIVSARVYFALGGQALSYLSNGPSLPAPGPTPAPSGAPTPTPPPAGGGPRNPSPWDGTLPNVNVPFDFVEYSWPVNSNFNIDVTQVDALGIPISFQLQSASVLGTTFGMQPNAVTKTIADFTTLSSPAGATNWSGLVQKVGSYGFRIINPAHGVNGFSPSTCTANSSGPTFSATYFDNYVNAVWSTYTKVFMPLYYAGQVPISGTTPLYGLVDANNIFQFYATPDNTQPSVASISKPNTCDVLGNAGNLTPPGGAQGTYVGRALAVNFNRGTAGLQAASIARRGAETVGRTAQGTIPVGLPIQPLCGQSDWNLFYGGSLTQGGTTPVASVTTNWYSALMHKYGYASNAPTYPGLAYGFADDDECNNAAGVAAYAPDTSAPYASGQQWVVTLNPL